MICDHHVFRSTRHSECMMEDPLSLVLRAGQTQFGNSSEKKKSQNICILRCCRTFYSSLSLQIYDLLEGNSE